MLDNHLHLYARIYPPPQSTYKRFLSPSKVPSCTFSFHIPTKHTHHQTHHSFSLLLPELQMSSQSYGFSNSHVWMWGWTIKKVECQRIDAFELWCWIRLLRTCRFVPYNVEELSRMRKNTSGLDRERCSQRS